MANRSTGLMSKQNGSTREDRSRHDEFEAFDARSVRAGRIRLAIVGLSLSVVALNWLVPGFQSVSPGLACCAALLWLTNGIVDERDLGAPRIQTGCSNTGAFNAWKWGVGVPLLFAVWSCVDDTFWIGWFLLSAAAVGRGLDWSRDSRRRTSLARDRSFVRWLSLLGLAVAATLLGPNGMPWIEQARGEFVLTGRWLRTGAAITVASWRMLPASEPTLAASATTVIATPILSQHRQGANDAPLRKTEEG